VAVEPPPPIVILFRASLVITELSEVPARLLRLLVVVVNAILARFTANVM
jgi:hypothetical protein